MLAAHPPISHEGLCQSGLQGAAVLSAGLDSADLISQLRASHAHDAKSRLGVDVLTGGAGDMDKLGIFESFKVRPVCSLSFRGLLAERPLVSASSCRQSGQDCMFIC